MLTVRSRAAQIAGQADYLNLPVATYDDPGRAKLEADAYLALTSNYLADRLVSSEEHRGRFLASFVGHITDRYPFTGNRLIDPEEAFSVFGNCLKATYNDSSEIDAVLDHSPIGKVTKQACDQYVETCDNYLAGPGQQLKRVADPIGWYDSYRAPHILLSNGLLTFGNLAGGVARRACGIMTTPEHRADILRASARGLLKMASLSLNQSINTTGPDVLCTAEYVDIGMSVGRDRQLPAHADEVRAVTRPRHGCPAMPSLPGSETDLGGSAIKKLWAMTAELVIATNLHALDRDEPEYAIVTSYGL